MTEQEAPPQPAEGSTLKQAILDPLSDTWYGAEQEMNDEQLLDIINKDVDRTFPDIEYFRSEAVQKSLTNILFIYSKLNPDVSYKQGMHELAAPMLWVVAQDCILEDDMGFFKSEYSEADAFELFSQIMKSVKPWYMSVDSRSQPPIVTKSVHIQEDLLRKADPELYKALKTNAIEPQIWGIRWIRLLFGREFKYDQMLALWDSMFANPASVDNEEDADLEIVDYICVVMLLRVRSRLIDAEHTDMLTTLLNYPLDETTPETMFCYVTNASYLQRNLSPVGARYIYDQYSHIITPLSDSDPFSPLVPPSRMGLEGLMEKAKVYSKTVIDQTQKWDMDKLVRQINDVRSKARNGFDHASSAKFYDPTRDEALAGMLDAALETLRFENISDSGKSALETIKHVQQCLRDSAPSTSTPSSPSVSSPVASPLASIIHLGSPVSAQRRIRSHIALSPSPPPNLPRSSLSTSSRLLSKTEPPPNELLKTPTSAPSTPTKQPLFKSPARTSLAQSEFAWMISDVTTPPSKIGFLNTGTSASGSATKSKVLAPSSGPGSSHMKSADLFELS